MTYRVQRLESKGIADVDTPPTPGTVQLSCLDYGPDHTESTVIDDLQGLLQKPRPEGCNLRWINVDGLHPFVVNRFRQIVRYPYVGDRGRPARAATPEGLPI